MDSNFLEPPQFYETYIANHYGLNFEKISLTKVHHILKTAATVEQLNKYVNLLKINAKQYLLLNNPYDPPGFTLFYTMEDFLRFIAPALLENRITPSGRIREIYETVNFSAYPSSKTTELYLKIASHINTPKYVLKKFCFNFNNFYLNPQILEALICNPSTKHEWLMDEKFLNKITSNGDTAAKMLSLRKEFTKEDAKRIIYGDNPESIIVGMSKTVHACEEDKTYVGLHF